MISAVLIRLCLGLVCCAWLTSVSSADEPVALAAFVRSLLQTPDSETSFAEAKLALDRSVDPSVDVDGTLAELDRMTATVEKMLAMLPPEAAATDLERMKALRAFIYKPGWWNDNKPFGYDLSDPYGHAPGAQLLSHYLATRKGNCVSMPVLFVALGEKLGLAVTLAAAPEHLFVKWMDRATGKTWNLEATSGAGFTRDEHYRKLLPMTDEAIRNGVYLKALSRKKAIAALATDVLSQLLRAGRYEEAIQTADVLLQAWPADVNAMIGKGSAYAGLLKRDFVSRYKSERDIPKDKLAEAQRLSRENSRAFAQAEALGWRAPKMARQ